MAMSSSQVRVVDPVLTEVAQGFRHEEHVGSLLFPRVPVQSSGGQVLEFGKESFKLYQARRAPGSVTKRVQFGYLGKSFALVQDALEGQVPREYLRDAARVPGVDLGQRAVMGTLRALSLTLEYDQAKLATTAGNYDSNHKVTLSGSSKWSDASSDPTGDIDDGKEAIRSSVGIYPNMLLLSAQAFNVVKEHPKVVERFKYTSRDSVTPDMLAALWDLQTVAVGKAVAFDDAGNDLDIWGNNAILAYVPQQSSGMEEPSFGYTYTMQNHPVVERPYYENNARSWIYPVTYERVPVLTGMMSGFLIQAPA
ncbi:major capsid protein [Candidatus Magnetaquicoccus inordinatus]|uniref:major capsid protein n=1 Tax=Candidatus Magnetaquicoccus inordinatus TaxID=2496818 RepID=UPI00102AB449|nr:major capsid protein [Candidatus Magnetaquicoccus inordinatus]